MTSLSEGMFLPSNQEVIEFEFENKKIDVLFFIDTSGSCISYKDRFFDSAMSLDKNKFQNNIIKTATFKNIWVNTGKAIFDESTINTMK